MQENKLRSILIFNIENAIQNGYTHFIAGGAIGFDMLAAECVLELQSSHNDLSLEIAIPCENQSKYYTAEQKVRYASIISAATKTTQVCTHYTKYCMQKRNEYIVDNSSLVIAYFTGTPSGTKNTIDFAKRNGVKIVYIWKTIENTISFKNQPT